MCLSCPNNIAQQRRWSACATDHHMASFLASFPWGDDGCFILAMDKKDNLKSVAVFLKNT
jgi:hypothetical protein